MQSNIMKKIISVVALMTVVLCNAQDGWNWGADTKASKGSWDYMVRLIESDKLVEAAQPCQWLLANTPDLNVGLYVYAEKIYKEKIKQEDNKDHLSVLHDSLLNIYDTRISLYGDEAKILNKKGKVAWAYLYKDKSKHDELYSLYQKVYELNGAKAYDVNLFYYFSSASRQMKKGAIQENELLSLYNTLNDDLENRKIEAGDDEKNVNRIQKYQDKIDSELNKYVTLDCDFVKRNYAPKFNSAPSVELAHKMHGLMKMEKECMTSELYLNVSKFLVKEEGESYGGLKNIGNIYYKLNNVDSAYVYYSRAIDVATDSVDIGNSKMDLALIDKQLGDKRKSITHIQEAIAYNPTLSGQGHTMIGDMYVESAGACSEGDALQDRLIYIAAYNEYKKAGNVSKMNMAKSQFPSMEEIFVRNHKVGDKMDTGCWTNVQVTLGKRD